MERDLGKYCHNMEPAYKEKLFWIKELSIFLNAPITIIDFGCADGYLLEQIRKELPLAKLFGYDISKGMISKANERNIPNCIFTAKLNELIDMKSDLILFSSVFHELFSLQGFDFNSIKKLCNSTKYIAIRDMYYKSNSKDKLNLQLFNNIKKFTCQERRREFAYTFGDLTILKNQIHFILKNRDEYDWSAEMQENYFAFSDKMINIKKMQKTFMNSKYKLIHQDFYIPSFLRLEFMEKYGLFDLDVTTHCNLIFENKAINN